MKRQWKCSKCGQIESHAYADLCKGYCFDASGNSCNGAACSGCGEKHWWTGSFLKLGPEFVNTHGDACHELDATDFT